MHKDQPWFDLCTPRIEQLAMHQCPVSGGERDRARADHRRDNIAGVRSNGSEFTVLTLGQYGLHDLRHHLWDVGVGSP